jgi:PIN domain nuclease of toxin-antitoxin system
MKLLLDTHAFIWLDIAQNQLSSSARQALQDPENILYLSLASVWEMQLKTQLGKLQLNASLGDTLASQQQANAVQSLPIDLSHILALSNLPYHHQDPFDRLLIAQAQVETLTIVTNDPKIQLYNISYLW